MDVALDIDRGMPRLTGIGGARDAADVDVDQERDVVARRRHRANPERWSHYLSIDNGRAGVPGVAAIDVFKCAEVVLCSFGIDA
jgi:hypothetical protein